MRSTSFFPGPSALPTVVLSQLQNELMDFNNTGLSIMEIGHRDKMIMDLLLENISYIKRFLGADDRYEVLFMHGGASSQFFAVPMNLLANGKALYLNTGEFSSRAIKVARQYGEIDEIIAHNDYLSIKNEIFDCSTYSYAYYCPNETVNGLQFAEYPFKNARVVADMTSILLASPFELDRYDMIFASSQKTLGIVGLTLVVIKKELLNIKAMPFTPSLFDYSKVLALDSMPNTVSTWTILVMNKILKWYESRGGITEIYKENLEKANLLYSTIDDSNLYKNNIAKENRSLVNVVFRLPSEELEQRFLLEATKIGFYGLKGHKAVGGIRVSMYNAILLEDIKKLVVFMKEFALGKI